MYSLRRNQDPAPRLHYCFLTAPPLSLISNCLNLPSGTQGRSWKLESIPHKQEMGDTERLSCPAAPQGPAWLPPQCFAVDLMVGPFLLPSLPPSLSLIPSPLPFSFSHSLFLLWKVPNINKSRKNKKCHESPHTHHLG